MFPSVAMYHKQFNETFYSPKYLGKVARTNRILQNSPKYLGKLTRSTKILQNFWLTLVIRQTRTYY